MRMILAIVFSILFSAASADETAFQTGPVFDDAGPHAPVPGATPIPDGVAFKISFDTSKASESGKENRTLVAAARFINMHAAAGVDPAAIDLAVVIHGKAVNDVTKDASDNLALMEALFSQNVRIIVCGQSAAYYGVTTQELAPNVEMALSAMTAHAILQQDDYTLNPF